MTRLCGLFLVTSIAVLSVHAEMRTWTAADGSSTIEASLVHAGSKQVELVREDGRRIKVPISKLCKADREYLVGHQDEGNSGTGESEPDFSQLPYKVGQVTGPIKASGSSHYYYYVPKSLKPGRKAPILFYNNSNKGNARLLSPLVQGAEICQWIIVASVESQNGNGLLNNSQTAEVAIEHILKTLPIEEDRLYFTGNSGGGAQSFYNYEKLDGYGLMPSIGYIPLEVSTPRCDCFIISGAWDFNRYTSAYARKAIGDSAIHRFHPAGHRSAPGWLMIEGMVWLEGRYLAKKGKKFPSLQTQYIDSVTAWIEEMQERQAFRAYYWALFLQEELRLSKGDADKVEKLITLQGTDPNNRLYAEALEDIDRLSADELSKFGRGSMYNHADAGVVSDCEDLLKKYKGVPEIVELLNGLIQPSQGG